MASRSVHELEDEVSELRIAVREAQERGDDDAVAAIVSAYAEAIEALDAARDAGEQVVLHVYDLTSGPVPTANKITSVIGLGAFHGGIEVYGSEFYFTFDAGVVTCTPGGNTAHVYKEAVPLGVTSLSRREVKAVIKDMRRNDGWISDNYDLLNRNCLHFAADFATRLGIRKSAFPKYLNRLAGIGSSLDSVARRVAGTSLGFLHAAKSFATASGSSGDPEADRGT